MREISASLYGSVSSAVRSPAGPLASVLAPK